MGRVQTAWQPRKGLWAGRGVGQLARIWFPVVAVAAGVPGQVGTGAMKGATGSSAKATSPGCGWGSLDLKR